MGGLSDPCPSQPVPRTNGSRDGTNCLSLHAKRLKRFELPATVPRSRSMWPSTLICPGQEPATGRCSGTTPLANREQGPTGILHASCGTLPFPPPTRRLVLSTEEFAVEGSGGGGDATGCSDHLLAQSRQPHQCTVELLCSATRSCSKRVNRFRERSMKAWHGRSWLRDRFPGEQHPTTLLLLIRCRPASMAQSRNLRASSCRTSSGLLPRVSGPRCHLRTCGIGDFKAGHWPLAAILKGMEKKLNTHLASNDNKDRGRLHHTSSRHKIFLHIDQIHKTL